MSSFLDAVIQDGPNKGRTIRECIALGLPRNWKAGVEFKAKINRESKQQ
jgi:hypothetical protein